MRKLFLLPALLALTACQDPTTFYWHNTRQQADTVPDPVNAQRLLESDLGDCVVKTEALNKMAQVNTPVSTYRGEVVDKIGTDRAETDLPSVYQLEDCMAPKGWVKLDHYYTAPY